MHSERCYWWRYIRKLVLNESATALSWGSCAHSGLEYLYETGSVGDACKAVREDEETMSILNSLAASTHLSVERLDLMLELYAKQYLDSDNERYELVSTERDVTLRLNDEDARHDFAIDWRGIHDLVVRDKEDGKVYIIDHKTTEKKVESSYYSARFSNDSQMTSYHWMGQQLYGEEFGGILINAIQTTKTIPATFARFSVVRDAWQTFEWRNNILAISPRIQRAHEIGPKLLAEGFREHNPEVLREFPMRTGYSENFCDYRHLNNEPPSLREMFVESLYTTKVKQEDATPD